MRAILTAFFAIVALGVAAYAYHEMQVPKAMSESESTSAPALTSYTNSAFGFTFSYPSGYALTETPHDGVFTVSLVKREDSAPRENSEGPTGITISIYPSTDETAIGWAERAPESNFDLSDKQIASASVGGLAAISYKWSGLYEADNTVFLRDGEAYSAAVTYIAPEDPARTVYTGILSSMVFFPVTAPATISGTYVCLAHVDTTGPQTDECALGIKADDGKQYAMDFNEFPGGAASLGFGTGTHIKVSGPVVPAETLSTDQWRKYGITGIIRVQTVQKI